MLTIFEPWQDRVVLEKLQLDHKLSDLRAFIASHTFQGLESAERQRLLAQREAMVAYSRILGERVEAFRPTVVPG